ncbi:UPF0187-domain-containing protein [Mycena amicta]|nr:UPF0187-domain-containing protein [Mycena amicta]
MVKSTFFVGWTLKKFNATVVNDIWLDVLFLTIISTVVTCITKLTTHNLSINNVLFGVLGTVLGLVISFRTSSSYERYQEGRKMWTNVAIASRNIAQIIWIHVPMQRPESEGKKLTLVESVIEKKTMLNLVQAFSVSAKHLLREEPGAYYDDLYPLISCLPRFLDMQKRTQTPADILPLWAACDDERFALLESAECRSPSSHEKYESSLAKHGRHPRRTKTFDPEAALAHVPVHRPLAPARNAPKIGFFDCFSCSCGGKRQKSKLKGVRPLEDSNVPFEITIYLSSYLAYLLRNAWLLPAPAGGFFTNISILQDTLANLERIASTPLPFAYQAHLRMSLWLYLLFLPFQVVGLLGYMTIPGTAFAAFLFLGFLEIGQEIENPFNYDLNDLDLDSFCLAIQRELHEIAAHTAPDPTEYVFSAWNQPFAPTDRRSGDALVANAAEYVSQSEADAGCEPGLRSMQRMLVRNWRDVDKMTRA